MFVSETFDVDRALRIFAMIDEAKEWARKVGVTPADVDEAIKTVRNEKRAENANSN